jgi:hypothetical protein
MRHINQYTAWPNGWRKKQSEEYGTLVEKYDARYAFDPRTLTGTTVWGVPKFLWMGGDTPLIAPDPATTMTAVGTVLTGQPTPYQYPDGTDATCDVFATNAYRRDNVRTLAPANTNDIVYTIKFRRPYFNTVGNITLFGNRSGGAGFPGFEGYLTSGGGYPTWYLRVGASTASDSAITTTAARSWSVVTFLLDRTGLDGYSWVNHYSGGTAAFPAGSLVGDGISLGALVNGLEFAEDGFAIEWVACWYDDGIFANWSADSYRLAKRLNMEAMGLRETQTNSKYWIFSGAGNGGGSYKDHNGRWAFAYGDSHRAIMAGNPNGLILNPATLPVSPGSGYNWSPTGVVAWTLSGGAMAVVNDAAALATAKAEVWGPDVYEFTNATGAPQTAYCGSDCTNSYFQAHVLARYVSGAGATIGIRETATGNYTPLANVLDGYAHTFSTYALIPAGWKWTVQIPDGCVLRFIANSLMGGTGGANGIAGYPMPFRTAPWNGQPMGAAHTVTEHTPVNASGSLLINIAPISWSGVEGKADTRIFRTVADATAIMYDENTAPGGWSMTDGTTILALNSLYNPVNGVYQLLWMSWSTTTGLMKLKDTAVAGSLVTAAYDGVMPVSGALEPYATDTGCAVAIKYIEVRQIA